MIVVDVIGVVLIALVIFIVVVVVARGINGVFVAHSLASERG